MRRMRSITLKLVFSFVGVSLVSVLLIVLFARYTTDQEFRRFTTTNDRSNLMQTLQAYYTTNGSWKGIDNADLFLRYPAPGNSPPPRPSSSLVVADQSGTVIRPGANFRLGDTVPADAIERGAPIRVDGKTVGYLIFSPTPFDRNSPERDFLDRTTQFLFYSALATMAIALLIGILLSRSLTSPIRALTQATHAVSQGDLSQQVPIRSRDEL